MIRAVILAAALSCALACLSSVAEARHYRAQPGNQVGCSQPEMRPCDSVVRKFRTTQRIGKKGRFVQLRDNPVIKPARYIAGRLVCAVNVNAELARRGIRGTGSALAKSFLHWGRPSRPVAGAVAVYGRRGGGHVAIVSRVVGGRVYVWNPSSRAHRWREVEYRRRAIAYRVAAQ